MLELLVVDVVNRRRVRWNHAVGTERVLVLATGGPCHVARGLNPLDLGLEPVLVVGRVLDYALGAIRFQHAVRAPDVAVAVAHFVLVFDVTGYWVVYRVPEVIRVRAVRAVVVVAEAS